MGTTKTALSIEVSGLGGPFELRSFDGSDGSFKSVGGLQIIGPRAAVIRNTNTTEDSLWEGMVLLSADGLEIRFSLLIVPDGASPESEYLLWKELPPVLSVFEGGYVPLTLDEVGRLLDDVIEFNDSVSGTLHWSESSTSKHCSVRFTDQDSLKVLSEIAIEIPPSTSLKSGTVVALEFQQFEVTYWLVAVVADTDNGIAILTLTAHIYRERRRVGRRISTVSDFKLGRYTVLEISDLGMKLAVASGMDDHPIGSEIQIPFSDDESLRFKVIYTRQLEDTCHVGLQLRAAGEHARRVWQDFILQFQYPLLRRRQPRDHERLWNHLDKTGYLSMGFGKAVVEARAEIFQEWTRIDETGPHQGCAVIGEADDSIVATIGVSRASDCVWAAQTAAVLDKPTYLPFTRAIYGWRTRYILQQPDGEYHLAFFYRDKPFLDRFFRKFFLQQGGRNSEKLNWTEWKYYAHILGREQEETPWPDGNANEELRQQLIFRLLAKNSDSGLLEIMSSPGAITLRGRPFLHICQYFSSVWLSPHLSADAAKNIPGPPFSGKLRFYSIRTAREDDADQLQSFRQSGDLHFGGWEVVWICHRDLLPLFLSNSIKALELMHRKYAKGAPA